MRSGAEVRKPRVQPWNPGVGITEPALFRRTTGVGVSESRVVGIARQDAEREQTPCCGGSRSRRSVKRQPLIGGRSFGSRRVLAGMRAMRTTGALAVTNADSASPELTIVAAP